LRRFFVVLRSPVSRVLLKIGFGGVWKLGGVGENIVADVRRGVIAGIARIILIVLAVPTVIRLIVRHIVAGIAGVVIARIVSRVVSRISGIVPYVAGVIVE
jgi:hypothetical protein